MNQPVVDYVSSCLESGYELEAIKDRLIEAGHRERDVDEAVQTVLGRQLGGADRSTFDGTENIDPGGDLLASADQNVHANKMSPSAEEQSVLTAAKANLPLYSSIWLFLAHPARHYETTHRTPFWRILVYNFVLVFVWAFSFFKLGSLSNHYYYSVTSLGETIQLGVSSLSWISRIVVVLFIVEGLLVLLLHKVAKALNGNGGFMETYKIFTYAKLPVVLMAVVPVLGVMIPIEYVLGILLAIMAWITYLLYVYTKMSHNLSTFKAVIFVLCSLALLGIIVAGLVWFFIAVFGQVRI